MKQFIALFIVFINFSFISAQTDTSNISAGWGNLDFAIPESPAFKLLGTNPDNILQPTSVRNAAISIGNYFAANSNVIPKNLAVEISPLLLNGNASLNDYNADKFLYRTRLSLGTNVGSNGANEIAEGIRMTILDNTDLRSNNDILGLRYLDATIKSHFLDRAIQCYAQNSSSKTSIIILSDNYSDTSNKIFRHTIDSIEKKLYYDSVKTSISDSISKFREELWNAPIWEIGAAALQSSADSLIKNLEFAKAGIWSTFGTHFMKKDQILIGAKVEFADSAKWQTNLSIGSRYYYGINEVKAFAEVEYNYINSTNGGIGSLGCQFNITNGLWGQFSVNAVIDNKWNVSYNPSFNIGFGTPDKGKSINGN